MISVVIPVWILNEEIYKLTVDTLGSLRNSEGEYELIIIDNGSPIGGDQLLANSGADILVRNKENLGYPKAVNQGIKLSHGEFVCIANNDIRVSPNWIKVTHEIFKKLPKAGSLHFKMVGYEEPFNLGKAVWDKDKERWCHGSFFVWRKKALDEIVGLDEGYGLGGYDDYDWQYRMRNQKGWSTVYTNGAAFQHKDSSTQNLLEQESRKTSDNKNREYFKKKFKDYPDAIWEKEYAKQMDIPWKPFP